MQLPIKIDLKNLIQQEVAPNEQCLAEVNTKYHAWTQASHAGFRKILTNNSKEAPNLQSIINLANNKRSINGKKITNFVLLGTGGSSLGSETLLCALTKPQTGIKFYILENNDPDFFSSILTEIKQDQTLFFVVSKSGSTPETISQFLAAVEWMKTKLADEWKKYFIFCTDPEKSDLLELCKNTQIDFLPIPSSVGGRFSVLTPVGLFPAAFAGIKIGGLISGAKSLVDAWEHLPIQNIPAFQMAYHLIQRPERITVMMPYSSQLQAFSKWFCQLWAESLGKNQKGFTPYPAIGTTDQHSQIQLYMDGPHDKVIGFVHIKNHKENLNLVKIKEAEGLKSFSILEKISMHTLFEAEFQATRDALTKNHIPNFTIELELLNEESLGALLYFWQWTTVYTGALLDIDPFTQPGVEEGKILTKKYLMSSKN